MTAALFLLSWSTATAAGAADKPAPRNTAVHRAVDDLVTHLLPAIVASSPAEHTTRLAVIELEAISPAARSGQTGRILSDLLTVRLSQEPSVELVERSMLHRILEEQHLSRSGIIDPKTAKAVGALLSLDFILAGSVAELGDNFEVSVRAINVEQAKVAGAKLVEIPKVAFTGTGAAANADRIQQSLDILESALVAYGSSHRQGFVIRWPESLDELVSGYLDRVPDPQHGQWIYDPKRGTIAHSTFTELRPTYPRLSLQGTLDDAKREFLAAQLAEIRRELALFCAQYDKPPPTLETVMSMPTMPPYHQGMSGELPPEAREVDVRPTIREAWNAAVPELRTRADCGGAAAAG